MEIKTVRTSGVAPHIPVIEPLSIINNGTYTAPEGVDGYSPITVDVQEQPWQPLEDGYSNFWFELTDDTLSPWLNFSAKNADAVIDWGDGSGEVALDTLTPTHTYAKAGKYVVKVKGVSGIAAQSYTGHEHYIQILKNVELNSDVTSTAMNSFSTNPTLANFVFSSSFASVGASSFAFCSSIFALDLSNTAVTVINNYTFNYCSSLYNVALPNITNLGYGAFQYCYNLCEIALPQSLTTIGNAAFYQCNNLREIHIAATVPPTLGTNALNGLPAEWICYVPVGTGDTYKAAAGWSAYSDHILEEGQTVTRAMQSKFKKEAEKSDNDEDKR